MPRYGWEIQTSDTPGAGTDAKVFLSLEGDQGQTKEMYLADPSAINDWERGDLNTGTFQTTELGNLIRGTLRHDGSGLGSDWTVDLVTVRHEDTGRAWVSGVNATLKAKTPFRLVFRPVREEAQPRPVASYEQQPKAQFGNRIDPGEADFSVRRAVATRQSQEPMDEAVVEPGVVPAMDRSVNRQTQAGEVHRQLPPKNPERAVPRRVAPPRQRALPPAAQSPGDPASERALDALREQGFTDAQIVRRLEGLRAAGYSDAQIEQGAAVLGSPQQPGRDVFGFEDEAQLAALRAQGLNDEEILARLRAAEPAEGNPLRSAEGRTMAGAEGQARQSDKPDYGAEYEGFSSESAPVVKLADDETVEV